MDHNGPAEQLNQFFGRSKKNFGVKKCGVKWRFLKAYYYKKVGLVDLSTHGGEIKFEFGRPAQRCLDSQN